MKAIKNPKKALSHLADGAAKYVDRAMKPLDKATNLAKRGLRKVTKATGLSKYNKHVDAAVDTGKLFIPGVAQAEAVRGGVKTFQSMAKGLNKNGWRGALKGAASGLTNMALSKIPGGKLLKKVGGSRFNTHK